jgi:beta-N-acetylhexosaminidase
MKHSAIQSRVFALIIIGVLPGALPSIAQRPKAASSRNATVAQERWADRLLRSLTLEEKIGQMIEVRGIMRFYGAYDPVFRKLVDDIDRYHLGAVHLTVDLDGALLVRAQPYEAAMTVRRLQTETHGKVPLIFSADFERGPSMRLSAMEYFPHAMAFGATHNPEYAERFGQIVAEESRAIGITWNYYPIADVQINPKNPIINTRSFGENPSEVSAMVTAYIRGSHAGGMLTTLKHFPGHGDTDTDSHLQLARVNAPLSRLDAVELPPFRAGIAAGSDAVMIAHVGFPALEPDPTKIATTSQKVVTGLLREQMGFKGVIVSDAMEMQGLTKLYPPDSGNPAGRAAVDAVIAGQDFLELPSDLDGTYRGLLQAVRSGEISIDRINSSVRRILLAKAKTGLNSRTVKPVSLDAVQKSFGTAEDYAFAQEVAEHAITLVRDDNHMLPLSRGDGGSTLVVLFVGDPHGDDGRALEQQVRIRMPQATVVYVDRRNASLEADAIAAMLPKFKRVIAALYAVPQPGQVGSQTSVDQRTGAVVLQNLLNLVADRTAVLAMGSPYVILDYPTIKTYVCAFSSVSTSEKAMVRALFGEIPTRGRLPVTLPGVAPIGAGLESSSR